MSAFVTKVNERRGEKIEEGKAQRRIKRKLAQRERNKGRKGTESKASEGESVCVNSMSEGSLEAIGET